MRTQAIAIGIGTVAVIGTIVGVVAAQDGGAPNEGAEASPSAQASRDSGVASRSASGLRQSGNRVGSGGSEGRQPRRTEAAPPRSERAEAGSDDRDRRGPGGFERPDNWDEMSREERRDYMRERWRERRSRMIERYDRNGDGELSREERREMRTAMVRNRMEDVWGGEVPLDDEEVMESMRLMGQEMRRRFSEIRETADENGDGELSREERRLARDLAGDMFRQMQDEFIAEHDSDRSGSLNASERAAAAEAVRHEIAVHEAYREIDTNGDGVVQQREVSEHSARLSDGESGADLNGDGRITSADTSLMLEAAQMEPPPETPSFGGPRGDGDRRRGPRNGSGDSDDSESRPSDDDQSRNEDGG